MKITAAQFRNLIDSTPITDPSPEREVPRYAVLAAELMQERRRERTRRWRLFRAFLPALLLVGAASASTVFVDTDGNPIFSIPLPLDKNVVIVVPTGGGLVPMRTPAPGTPAPTYKP